MDPLQIIEGIGIENEDISDYASQLALEAYRNFQTTGEQPPLLFAIECAQLAVSKALDGDEYKVVYLDLLQLMLGCQYDFTHDIKYLDESIRVSREVISTNPGQHSRLAAQLHGLGVKLNERYKLLRSIVDLDESIRVTQEAIDTSPEGDPALVGRLNDLAIYLHAQYESTGIEENLQKAIQTSQQAISTESDNSSYQPRSMSNLGIQLRSRYQRTGDPSDIQEAIRITREAVDLTPDGNTDLSLYLNNLGNHLEDQYEITNDISDIDEAVMLAQRSVDLSQEDNFTHRSCLNNLGSKLQTKYTHTGDLASLDEAIRVIRKAVSIELGKVGLADSLNNLGATLSCRYDRTGEIEDLEEAITLVRQAIALFSNSVPEALEVQNSQATMLSNLGNWLENRFDRLKEPSNLEEAIQVAREAVRITPDGNSDKPGWLSNLGNRLQTKYNHTGDLKYLNEAICHAQEAVDTTPNDYPTMARFLTNLGSKLEYRYDRTKSQLDLEASIQVAQRAVNLTPSSHAGLASRLNNLGIKLLRQHEQNGSEKYLGLALENFLSAFQALHAPPLVRVQAARLSMQILLSMKDWERAVSITVEALKLLPYICGRYKSLQDQQYAIVQTSGLAADACSLIIRAGSANKALQQLEFGRGIIFGYMIDNRGDISRLKESYPQLAEKLESLQDRLAHVADSKISVVREKRFEERRKIISDIDDCLKQITKLPGYERYLSEPTIEELQSVAIDGPIVIVNVTDISADAIILTRQTTEVVPLPGLLSTTAPTSFQRHLRYHELSRTRGSYRDIQPEDSSSGARWESCHLSWLWVNGVKPVLDKLNIMESSTNADLPRVFWIGCGAANSLPFHAAGSDFEIATENAMSQIISSYTPTIKALRYSQSRATWGVENFGKELSVLVVTMPETPGHMPLQGVTREKTVIRGVCEGKYSYDELPSPTSREVLEKLSKSNIVHFACHGYADLINPLESHLLLQKRDQENVTVDKLTISSISKVTTRGQNWICYLSACSTAEVKADKLGDESLHLASAFQIAGFAHVIGSIWSANDDICVRVARAFYTELLQKSPIDLSNRSIAAALREAVVQIRSEFCNEPDVWAPFAHFGA